MLVLLTCFGLGALDVTGYCLHLASKATPKRPIQSTDSGVPDWWFVDPDFLWVRHRSWILLNSKVQKVCWVAPKRGAPQNRLLSKA